MSFKKKKTNFSKIYTIYSYFQNWAFLARFCFLSLDGQFEYLIEFDRDMGTPNLLLYYDDESQWPSVYHSSKVSMGLCFLILIKIFSDFRTSKRKSGTVYNKTKLYLSVTIIYVKIAQRYQSEVNIKYASLWSLGAQQNIKLLS